MNAVDRQQAEMLRDYLDNQRTRDPELRHILALADRALGQEAQSRLFHPPEPPTRLEDDESEEDIAA